MAVNYRDNTPFEGDNHTVGELAKAIRTKMYGVDVRESIAQAVEKMENWTKGNNIGQIIATPTKVFATLSDLQEAYPNGAEGVMLTADNGHKYYWNNNQWTDGGVYQSQGFSDDQAMSLNGALRAEAYVYDGTIFAQYDDANELPRNSIITYTYGNGMINNAPANVNVGSIITITSRDRTGGNVANDVMQVAYATDGKIHSRRRWGDTWTSWKALEAHETTNITSSSQIVAPYNDLNTFPKESVVTYSVNANGVSNLPDGLTGWFQVKTSDASSAIYTQQVVDSTGKFYCRVVNSYNSTFTPWVLINKRKDVNITNSSQIVAPYNDLNTFPPESAVTFSVNANGVSNLPDGLTGWFQVKTSETSSNIATQQVIDQNGSMFLRTMNLYNHTFTAWSKIDANTSEPYASFSIFPKFAVIGDSFASGVLGTNEDASEFQDAGNSYRWGDMVAKRYGLAYTHLAKGGLSTRTWLTDAAGLSAMQAAEAQDLYMLCLGINDYYGLGTSYLGSEADMTSKSDTFYGNYAKIIEAIKTKAPNAKIIMFGVANDSETAQAFSAAQEKIAEHYGIPFISEREDSLFTSDFYLSNMQGGHPRVPVYGAMAKAMVRLTERVIERNLDYFNDISWS